MFAGEPTHKLFIHYNKKSYTIKDVRSEEYKHQELMNDVFERVLEQHPSNINLYFTVKVLLPESTESMELKTDDDMKTMFDNHRKIQNIHLVLTVSISSRAPSETVVAPPEEQQPEGQSGRLVVPQPNPDIHGWQQVGIRMFAGEPTHELVIHYNKKRYTVKDVRSGEYKHKELMNDVFERVLEQHPSNINLYLTVKVPLPGSMESMELKTDDDMKTMFDNYRRIQYIHLVLTVSVSSPAPSETVVAPPEQQQPEGQSRRLVVPKPDLLKEARRFMRQEARRLRWFYGPPIGQTHNAPITLFEAMWVVMQQLHLPQPQLPIQEEEPGEEEGSK